MMILKRPCLAAVTVVVVLFAASASMSATDTRKEAAAVTSDLNDTAWVLSELVDTALLPDSPVTLNFADGGVYGSDGCNRYRGGYRADAEGFRLIGSLAGTQMACPEPVMRQASAFIEALSSARAAQLREGRLILSDEDGRALAVLDPQDRDLHGTAWRVTGYNNGRQAVVSLLAGSTMTAKFGDDGNVVGSAGCNVYSGPYTISGRAIEIGPLLSTQEVCDQPEGVMDQEAAFLRALPQVADVRIEGDRLELRDQAGALMVTAARMTDDEGTASDPHPEDEP